MAAVAEITLHEKILIAAYALEEEGLTPFSAEALIVNSWKKYPQAFGLKDYAELYPDSNKILVALMGERGLARRGWLVKLGRKQYSLSREGRQLVRHLLEGGEEPKPPERVRKPRPGTMQLSRDLEKHLNALLSSTALEKYREDRKGELAFADACRFWGITENLSGPDLDERLRGFRTSMGDSERLLSSGGEAVLQGGRSVSAAELAQLDELNGYLEQRFGRHLALLRSRTSRN